jgi:hypothetical protein
LSVQNFSWVIPNKLAGCAIPSFIPGGRSDAEWLAASGVGMLVSFTMPNGDPEEECARCGIEWVYYPIEDFDAPEDDGSFSELIDKIVAAMRDGIGVCAHCYAGVGRTGLALVCAVGRYLSIPADKAISRVRGIRMSMEARVQEDYARRFLDGR